MSNAIPLASVRVLLRESGYPDGHPIGGVFKLELESIGQSRPAGDDLDTYTINFGKLFRFGIAFIDRDGTGILMVSGSRIDKLESESCRVGHDSEDAGER